MRSRREWNLTRSLLACGVVAGPLYVVVGLIQAFIRDGYDPTRHPLSVMSNGDLGWIQIGNFLVSGLLVVACAVGMRRSLHPGRGASWGPMLVGVYGLGLVGAGIFIADPMEGFPPGTPSSPTGAISSHGFLHFVAGGVGFFAVIGACLVFARRFAALGKPGWALYSAATGVLFLAAFFGISSGSKQAWIIIAFTVAVVLVWVWIAAIAALLMTEHSNGN